MVAKQTVSRKGEISDTPSVCLPSEKPSPELTGLPESLFPCQIPLRSRKEKRCRSPGFVIIEPLDEHLKNANGKCWINMIYSIFKHKYQEPTVKCAIFKKGFF